MLQQEGRIFKYHRKKRNKTINDISVITSITITKISDFENGKCQLSTKMIEKLYQCLGISYMRDFTKIKSFCVLFYEFYRRIFYKDDFESTYQQLKEFEPQVIATIYYPQFMLAQLIYHLSARKPYDYTHTIPVLEKMLDFLDDNQKQIYFDSAGLYYKNIMNIGKSLIYFNKASIYGYPPATAMILYHKGDLLDMNNELTKALECLKQSRIYFMEQINIKRLLLCNLTIASVYRMLGLYEDSITLLKLCLPHIIRLGLEEDILIALNNITWSYLLMKNYEQTIICATKTLKQYPNDIKSYIFLAYSYSHLKNKNKAREMIRFAKRNVKLIGTTPFISLLVSTYHTILSDQKHIDTKIKKLKILLMKKEVSVSLEMHIFLVEMMLELLSQTQRKDDIEHYQAELTECFRMRK